MKNLTARFGAAKQAGFSAKRIWFLAVLGAVFLAFPVAAQIECTADGGQALDLDVIGLTVPIPVSTNEPQRILVAPTSAGLAEGAGVMSVLAQTIGVQAVENLRHQNTQIWSLPPEIDASSLVSLLNNHELVRHAEPDSYRVPHANPNDSLRCNQWYVENVADSYYGVTATTGADLKLSDAWDISTGSEQVVIALIDNGVDLDHPDLVRNLWLNTDEIPDNGIDDDQNGYIDDFRGWDFNRNDNDPSPESNGRNHGTAVAGPLGAVGNNFIGIAGANWDVRIMVLKTDYSVSTTVKAMEYALDNGAQIVNASFGGAEFSRTEFSAIEALRDSGVLLVASAGNEHWDNDFGPNYPGSYDLSNIIAVAATSTKDDFVPYTQHGQISVDVAAPGDVIITTEANGSLAEESYAVRSGTSFSSSLVAGVAGLIKSHYPAASAGEIKARIMASVDPIANARCGIGSGGRVNALTALEMSQQPVPVLTGVEWIDGGNNQPDPGEPAVIRLAFETLWGNVGQTNVTIASGDPAIRLLDTEVVLPSLDAAGVFSLSLNAVAAPTLSGHNRVPLTVNFSSPGFSAERAICLIAAPLSVAQPVQAVLQTSQLVDVQRYHIEVPAAASNLQLMLNSNRNVDLYARFGNWPARDEVLRTTSNYVAGETTHIAASSGGDEALNIADPKPGTWYVMVVNAEQGADTQYTLNSSFAADGDSPGPGPGSGPDPEPAPEPDSQQPIAVPGGGAAGWMLFLLICIQLKRVCSQQAPGGKFL